jgi:coronin-1B/1C/6
VLTSASGDHLVRVWDIEGSADKPTISLSGHKDSVQSIAWNSVGNTLATTCRDRKLRIFDPRAGAEAVRVAEGHGGIKGSRVVWLGDRDRLATTGFSRMSDRQLMLWETAGLTQLQTESLDSSAGIIIPYFAEGNDVLFLAGKGDGNIRYYEFEGDHFHFLSEHKTADPQRGIGFLPRRALDVSQNEIARAFKLSGRDVTPLSFIVPRKAEGFQSDLFPPANSAEPALKADEWFNGKDARPNVIDLETRAVSANKQPLATPKPTAPSTPKPSSPKPQQESKLKEEIKPEPQEEPKKEEPKPAPKAATPPPKEEPKKAEPEVKSRDLEIEQPDSSDDEGPSKAALGVASAVGGGAALGAAALAAKPASGAASGAASPNGGGSANTSDELLIKLISEGATLPTRGSALSAGHDLYAADGITVPARGKALVSTGLAIAVPAGTYGRIAPRSGLASKHSIDVGAGVIDADYRGEVKVLLFNYGGEDFKVAKGDRVAQLILERVHMAPVRQVEDLEATLRGAGGFGSTGGFA